MLIKSLLTFLAFLYISTEYSTEVQAACNFANGPPANTNPTALADGVVTYKTGLLVDIDGARNTYHSSGVVNADPALGGLDWICNGGNVSELRSGHLVNLYPDFGKPGASQQCLDDYRALKTAGFPSCVEGKKCMSFYAVALKDPRACGDGENTCGVPAPQIDATGKDTGFFVSATAWIRKDGKSDDPNTYLDARFIPYIVYSKSQLSQFGLAKGDLAVVAWQGRATFAIYGDTGNHLCEASVGTLDRLKGKADSDFPRWDDLGIAGGATVVGLSGSGKYLHPQFPDYHPTDPANGPSKQLLDAGKTAFAALSSDEQAKALGALGLHGVDQIKP